MWQLSGAHGYKPDVESSLADMKSLLEAGFVSFDLADHYGRHEHRPYVCHALKQIRLRRPGRGLRGRVQGAPPGAGIRGERYLPYQMGPAPWPHADGRRGAGARRLPQVAANFP